MELNPDLMAHLNYTRDGGVIVSAWGVQTFNNDLLKASLVVSIQKKRQFVLSKTRQVGFENMSIDLIFRLQG